jgi:cysteine desulfurase/selenocysteine lyase
MIDFVSIQEATYASLPHKFEAGTPNIVGAISLGKAINFIKKIGINNIQEHSKKITHIIVEGLLKVDGVKLIGNTDNRISIVSFVMNGAHPHDLALLLDKRGIAARAGHHCAQPAMRHFGVDTTLRVSAGMYNDEDDIAFFLQNLRDLKKYF